MSKLFVTPMSWILAVAVVLLDRALSLELPESPEWQELGSPT
ncbi:hypothetical protein [Rhodococcus sp. 14C212]|nr:hypothetical protein [Rhodococcus sp. 14C212]